MYFFQKANIYFALLFEDSVGTNKKLNFKQNIQNLEYINTKAHVQNEKEILV